MRVLFVCRGNVCRRRAGEQIFQVLTPRTLDGDTAARDVRKEREKVVKA